MHCGKRQQADRETWSGQVGRSRQIMLPQGSEKIVAWVSDKFLVPGSSFPHEACCTSIGTVKLSASLALTFSLSLFLLLVWMWFLVITNQRNLILKTSKKLKGQVGTSKCQLIIESLFFKNGCYIGIFRHSSA